MSKEEALRQMSDGLENGPMDADGDGIVDEDEFQMFYSDISAGIPSDDYFCYVAECVWNVHETGDVDPLETFKREMPRTTPATKDALHEQTVRLKKELDARPPPPRITNYVSAGPVSPRTRYIPHGA